LEIYTFKIKNKYTTKLEMGKLSRSIFDFLMNNPRFLEIFFILDNLNNIIWIWHSSQMKSTTFKLKNLLKMGERKKIFQIINVKRPKKREKLVKSLLKKKINSNFKDFSVRKVDGTDYSEEFDTLFQYEICEVNKYKIHYKKSEYVNIYDDNNNQEDKISVKKCKVCGWIMKENRKFCPNCKSRYEENLN